MNKRKGMTFRTVSTLLISAGLVGGLSACSTTKTIKMSEAAPVTYKIGEGSSSYASLRMPERAAPPATSLPYTAPSQSPLAVPARPAPRQVAAPAPIQMGAQQSVDLSNIDRGLHSHMKVGKSYKVAGKTYHPRHNPDYDKIGVASWYGDKFHGKPTANGEAYDKNAMTAAHKTLPLNSYAYVTNLDTGKSLKVRLNDRGPFIDGRIIDLSEAAATILDIRGSGTGRVRVQYAGAAPVTDSGHAFNRPPASVDQRPPASEAAASAPAPAPVWAPTPAPVAAPVAAPQVAERPVYVPLREMDQAPAFEVSQDQQTYVIPDAMTGSTSGLSIALPDRSANAYDMPPIPQAPIPDQPDDGIVTLTIKGPIHMAGSKGEVQEQPEFIPASYERTK